MIPRRMHASRRAFTLVELITTMTVVAALGSVVSVVIMSAVDSYSRASTTAQLHSELSITLDRLDQMLQYIPRSASAGPDIASVTATSITWSTNWSLSLTGTQLQLSEAGAASTVLLKDVSSLSIQTYDESDSALAASLSGAACAPIRRIRVTITLTRGGVSETLRTRIFIRSMVAGGG
jgi:type II secretory pathway pseudopilin PulG